jgi:hypothetical protein
VTHHLFVIGSRAAFRDEPELLRALIDRCPVLPADLHQHVRLVVRDLDGEVSIEPFIGAAAFRALLGRAQKRPHIEALLVALVDILRPHGPVRIRFEDASEGEEPREERGAIADLLASSPLPTHLEILIA